MTAWLHTISLADVREEAAEDAAKVPALLVAMADAVGPYDYEFSAELRDAAEDVEGSENPQADADFWLTQLYDWADARRVWVD
jgi:hypothetical protein